MSLIIRQVIGYARTAHDRSGHWPRRVAITNGDWLIVFLDPAGAFAEDRAKRGADILVLPDVRLVDVVAPHIFRSLAYQGLLDERDPFSPAELAFYFSAADVERALHGLRVKAGTKRGSRKVEPTIYVQPLLFLRTRGGGWIRVIEQGDHDEAELPHDARLLGEHLRKVDECGRRLLASVNQHFRAALQPTTVEDHYVDRRYFESLKGFTRLGNDEYEIVTGQSTHYLLDRPRVSACPFHTWSKSEQIGQAATLSAIMARSVEQRSFFHSGEDHHCSHRVTLTVKGEPLRDAIADRCGTRSGEDSQAFCEIYSLDKFLCCQACVLHDVCKQALVFCLPCHVTH